MPAFQDWVLVPLFSVLPYAGSCAAGPGPDAEKAVLSAFCSHCLSYAHHSGAGPPEPRVVTGFVQLCAGGL